MHVKFNNKSSSKKFLNTTFYSDQKVELSNDKDNTAIIDGKFKFIVNFYSV